MTTSDFFPLARPSILRRLHDGPLGPYIGDYASRLVEQGLGRSTGKRTLRLIADLSRWLERKGLTGRQARRAAQSRSWCAGFI